METEPDIPKFMYQYRCCGIDRELLLTKDEFLFFEAICPACNGVMPRHVPNEGGSDVPGGHGSRCWPMWSDTMGIHPTQLAEAKQLDKELGVSADYNRETGQVKFESAAHRKKYCEAHGFYDRNGGYGDPQRRRR